MTITTAIIRLEYYNEWRRGVETPHQPKELGKLIEFVIKELKKIESKTVEGEGGDQGKVKTPKSRRQTRLHTRHFLKFCGVWV